MYIRKRIPAKDDAILIEMVLDSFRVSRGVITSILKNAIDSLVVCNEQDVPVGFVSYRFRIMDIIYVDYVVFDEKYRGKGIATTLLPEFEQHIRRQGIKGIYATVDGENEDALRLFKRFGFNVAGKLGSSYIIEKFYSPQAEESSSVLKNTNAPMPQLAPNLRRK
ncbi:GNAT family N-acetyltransferase [Fictibacillus iocasae]|uniref:GNAT family N-acetyltransferase n=1 Tax=Fictibacillus iocasae TaxID=2715437 RepID=A0ABW2NNC8_9BACL